MSESSPEQQDSANGADRVTEAYQQIRKLVLFRHLSPGTPIIQARMANKLGHSRATLRAALQRLTQEGYMVETELGTYSRFVVASLTVEDMQELFAIVGALEGVAARQCAKLPEEERTEVADGMDDLNRQVAAMLERGKLGPEQANQTDTKFHNLFTQKARGSRLLPQLQSIRPQVERYRDLYTSRVIGEMRALGAPEHRAITEAIRSGKVDKSQRAVERHWRSGARRLKKLIVEMGEQRGYGGD